MSEQQVEEVKKEEETKSTDGVDDVVDVVDHEVIKQTPVFSIDKPPTPYMLEVSSHRTAEGSSPFTVYIVLIKWTGDNSWTVSHRFSEFDALHKKLAHKVSQLPDLPSKTWWRSLDPSFVQKRQKELDAYMQKLVKMPAVVHAPEFQEFIALDAHTDLTVETPSQAGVLVDELFGVAGFVYNLDQNIILTACEECHLLNKQRDVETTGIISPLGTFNVWTMEEQKKWVIINTEYYEQGATAIGFDPLRCYAFVGRDDGHLLTYLLDMEERKITSVNDIQVHSSRITSVVYDSKQDIVITTSSDKTMTLLDVKAKNGLLGTFTFDRGGLSAMIVEEDMKVAMVASQARTILLMNIEDPTYPRPALTLQGHKNAVTCLDFAAKERYLFSGGADGVVGIFQVPKGKDNVHRSRSVGWLVNGPPSKVHSVVFCPSLNYVISGHASGKVAVWDVFQQGALLFVWDAHPAAVVQFLWMDDAKILLTASQDGIIKFWNIPDRALV